MSFANMEPLNLDFETVSRLNPGAPARWYTGGRGYHIVHDTVAPYGSAMRVVGFAMGQGEYTAVGPRGLTSYPADAAPPGSVESVLRSTGIPRLALDLRSAARSAEGSWLADPHEFRSIGAMAIEQPFSPTPVARWFDVLLYIDRTTPTRLMPPAGGR